MNDVPEKNSRWRHRKGGIYIVIDVATGCGGSIEGQSLVVYFGVTTQGLWARPLSEFMDGRFFPDPD